MIISQTPLRLSLFGGNTDFPQYFLNYGGLCVTATIDKYIYCIVQKRFDDLIVVNYSAKETVKKVSDIRHNLVREALKLLEVDKGIEISFLADIPSQGSGLGSSSTLLVGLLNCLHVYKGENVGSKQLAEEAIHIEIKVLGNEIGILDQHIAAMGGFRAIEFSASNDVFGRKIEMDESIKEDFNNSLMLLYTGTTRKTKSVLSNDFVANNKVLLDQNKVFANEAIRALLKNNLKKVGEMWNIYWEMKRSVSDKVSNDKIDEMYKQAKDAGAIGGKVIGAGGGGFLLVMFPANKRAKVREALKDYKEMPFRFTDFGSRIIFNQ